ncbi:hypothetical protein EDI_201760 [Entamoeba dispar SAW760]|uniref:Saposin B-type domain-containing protein n=1 Tax=Entamoeba dispar (strain ATCC PRA-260 / SAW760) TaxID=370354 RepID=B0ETX1_ENTDS|nr:uncharacterized protein EDI_201760 [Entamoeba dispar SAW760]EDR22059.1 hypothetical protein EDI_201760 [Entamoeba dispar SAW760]|eukprot:EDR22059.1 hypothetical protein EDI_201760 [Entamoeba dispar SAW760]
MNTFIIILFISFVTSKQVNIVSTMETKSKEFAVECPDNIPKPICEEFISQKSFKPLGGIGSIATCKICESFVGIALDYVTKGETVENLNKKILDFCTIFSRELPHHYCFVIAQEIYVKVLNAVQNNETVDITLCSKINLC